MAQLRCAWSSQARRCAAPRAYARRPSTPLLTSHNSWRGFNPTAQAAALRAGSKLKRIVQANVAYQPSLDIPVHDAVQSTIDFGEDLDVWIPGTVFEVSSVQQITTMAQQHHNRKVILMCKSKSCRPCKAFTVTFKRIAEANPDAVFLSLIGETSPETRGLMIALGIRNTPTFLAFWKRAVVHRHSGISRQRMENLLAQDWQELADALSEPDVGDELLSL